MKSVWDIVCPVFLYELICITIDSAFGQLEVLECRLIGALLAIILFGLWFLKDQNKSVNDLIIRRISLKRTCHLIAFGISACIFVNNLIELSKLNLIFSGMNEVNTALYVPSYKLQILAIGIVIPIAEELVFRGMIYRRVRDICDFKRAAMISAFVFGVSHGNVVQGLYAFVIGMSLAWVYEEYHSILAPILLHVTVNLCSIWMTFLMGKYEAINKGISFIIMTTISGILVFWFAGKTKQEEG